MSWVTAPLGGRAAQFSGYCGRAEVVVAGPHAGDGVRVSIRYLGRDHVFLSRQPRAGIDGAEIIGRSIVAHRGQVIGTEWLTPHMIRVVLGGDGLHEFDAGAFTDHYVKIYFPPPGVTYDDPTDLTAIRASEPRERWPRSRTYTVRRWDPATRELTIDFVFHGDVGLAGPWAAGAKPGDELIFGGPGGAYAPDPAADWHLLAGDESALPAIAAAIEAMPPGARVRAFVEVSGPEEELPIDSAADVALVWLHRGTRAVGEALVEAVTAAEFGEGEVRVFVHGEAHFVRALRRYLRIDRGLPPGALSISGYWRLGADEDVWQTTKREWNADIVS